MPYSEEYLYSSENFTSFGAFNGFPIELPEKNRYLGIETGITTGTANTEVSCNNFWNLAEIEVEFVVQTKTVAPGYTQGITYNPDGAIETGHIVTVNYEIANSRTSGEYIPEKRMYAEHTGGIQEQAIDQYGLISGSGSNFSSCVMTETDFFVPITIQPENTGAYVITLDSGVAEYFSTQSGYETGIKKFKTNMLFDFGVSLLDEKGGEYNNIDYYSFTRTGYMVPASGWDFDVLGSKIKGLYYNYNDTQPALNEQFINVGFIPDKSTHPKFIAPGIENDLLGEPKPGEGSFYQTNPKNKIIKCIPGQAAQGNLNSNTNPIFKRFPKDHQLLKKEENRKMIFNYNLVPQEKYDIDASDTEGRGLTKGGSS